MTAMGTAILMAVEVCGVVLGSLVVEGGLVLVAEGVEVVVPVGVLVWLLVGTLKMDLSWESDQPPLGVTVVAPPVLLGDKKVSI